MNSTIEEGKEDRVRKNRWKEQKGEEKGEERVEGGNVTKYS